jgi:hypothetical protein
MKKLIVYGTQYGTTKRYAEKFSEIMDLPCMSYMSLFKISSDGPNSVGFTKANSKRVSGLEISIPLF